MPKFVTKDEAWHQRQLQWKHNAYSGHTRMSIANMKAVEVSASTTQMAKQVAHDIQLRLQLLRELLEYRVNIDGTTTKVKHANAHMPSSEDTYEDHQA